MVFITSPSFITAAFAALEPISIPTWYIFIFLLFQIKLKRAEGLSPALIAVHIL
jgi:hypothetical protein